MYMLEGHENPLLPSITNKTIKIPDVPGLYDFGAEIGPKYFNIPIGFVNSDYALMRRNAEQFLHQFIDEFAQPKEIELSFDYAPERVYKAKFNGDLLLLERLVKTLGRFDLPLVAYDPFAYSKSNAYDQEPITFDAGYNYDEGHMYPNTQFIEWDNIIQYAGVHNHSHYATPLNFVIEGQVINPRLTLNGKTTIFNVTLNVDERLYVDSKTQQAWVTKIERDEHGFLTPVMIDQSTDEWHQMNLYSQVIGQFPMLKSGDNQMKFEGGLPQAIITLDWEHRFL